MSLSVFDNQLDEPTHNPATTDMNIEDDNDFHSIIRTLATNDVMDDVVNTETTTVEDTTPPMTAEYVYTEPTTPIYEDTRLERYRRLRDGFQMDGFDATTKHLNHFIVVPKPKAFLSDL